jgi:spermidine synthase
VSRWVDETLHDDFRSGLKADRVLYDSATEHQHLLIFENARLGRVMTLDNVVQTTEGDEFIYHEMLAHVPILAHGAVERVLIVGGGDGGMLEEVLKHPGVAGVTMVEIDATVTELAKQHLRGICGQAFEDPRARLVIADGTRFVAETNERFDLVIVDSTDPIGPAVELFDQGFYAGCRRVMRDGGVLVTQNGVPFFQAGELAGTMKALKALFADASCYLATVPTYVGGPMAFGWASDDPTLRQVPPGVLARRLGESGIQGLRYYTPEVHKAAFALPPYVSRLLGAA